ncbi:hypothetical protein wTkk_000022 [Wolbachia endosymbiont of Trichogramma kaykai]
MHWRFASGSTMHISSNSHSVRLLYAVKHKSCDRCFPVIERIIWLYIGLSFIGSLLTEGCNLVSVSA